MLKTHDMFQIKTNQAPKTNKVSMEPFFILQIFNKTIAFTSA